MSRPTSSVPSRKPEPGGRHARADRHVGIVGAMQGVTMPARSADRSAAADRSTIGCAGPAVVQPQADGSAGRASGERNSSATAIRPLPPGRRRRGDHVDAGHPVAVRRAGDAAQRRARAGVSTSTPSCATSQRGWNAHPVGGRWAGRFACQRDAGHPGGRGPRRAAPWCRGAPDRCDVVGGADLDDATEVHHRDAVRDHARDRRGRG